MSEPSDSTVLSFPEHASAPGRKKKRLVIAGVAATVVALMVGVVALAQFSGWLAVKDIRVQGAQLAAEPVLQEKLAGLKGTPLTQITESDVSGLLGEVSSVQNIRIAAEPPSTLVVDVTERRPVAVLQVDNTFTLIDRNGVPLKNVASQEEAKLPLIDGGKSAAQSEVFSTITSVLQSLPDELLNQLAKASAKSSSSVELTLNNGIVIRWGSSEDNALKAAIVGVLLKQPAQDPPVTQIDVSVPQSPVTR